MVMEVVKKFFITSMFMWILPIAILYGFQHDLLPGLKELIALYLQTVVLVCLKNLSPYTQTLLCGFLAVISVNVVIAFYIYMAMKEPAHKHEPDPTFFANAKASVSQMVQTEPKSGGKED
ncbi:hypothetical protein KSS87_001451 [Heliosperma pusillum]|nr:hypothetical protein KSS87_001451 [Heliosperma pusillum]